MREEIRPGLWRWTAPHPEWHATNDDGAPTSWPREVGCVLYESAGRAVFIDPLVPEDEPAFWEWADQRCRGREVSVLETIAFHRRSREEFLARYSAAPAAPGDVVVSIPLPRFSETLFWIPEHRALIPGDVLLGAGDGDLRICPESWLEEVSEEPTHAALRTALAFLRELDIELVLVSHGEPVLRDGAAALARALA